MFWLDLQTVLISGLLLGSMYTLMGVGLSIIWSTLRVFNFTHGVLMLMGAYLAWTISNYRGLSIPLPFAVIFAVVCTFLFGTFIFRILVRSHLKRTNLVLTIIITTLAGLIFIQNSVQLIWGPRMKRLPKLIPGLINLFGINISAQEVFTIVFAPVIVFLLVLFLKRTRLGLAVRGIAQNRDSALLIGVNVPRIYSFTWGLSAALAALAGVMLGSIRLMTPLLGSDPLIKSVIVVILGGLASIWGTIIAAYVIGFLETICVLYLGLYWTPPVLFLVMILVLVFKPTGLFGEDK